MTLTTFGELLAGGGLAALGYILGYVLFWRHRDRIAAAEFAAKTLDAATRRSEARTEVLAPHPAPLVPLPPPGRDFDTQELGERLAETSFTKLHAAIIDAMDFEITLDHRGQILTQRITSEFAAIRATVGLS